MRERNAVKVARSVLRGGTASNVRLLPDFFAPKYRRKVAYGKIKQDIANILSMLCKRKGVKIVEAEICPDHVHMLVEIPPSISVSYFVGYLKGKSTLMIFERHANLKYKYGNRHFLVQRILCRYGRKKCEENSGIYS